MTDDHHRKADKSVILNKVAVRLAKNSLAGRGKCLVAGSTNRSLTAADVIEDEVQEALAILRGTT